MVETEDHELARLRLELSALRSDHTRLRLIVLRMLRSVGAPGVNVPSSSWGILVLTDPEAWALAEDATAPTPAKGTPRLTLPSTDTTEAFKARRNGPNSSTGPQRP